MLLLLSLTQSVSPQPNRRQRGRRLPESTLRSWWSRRGRGRRGSDYYKGKFRMISICTVPFISTSNGYSLCKTAFDMYVTGQLNLEAIHFYSSKRRVPSLLHRLSSARGRSFMCYVFGLCTLAGSKTKHTKHLPHLNERWCSGMAMPIH